MFGLYSTKKTGIGGGQYSTEKQVLGIGVWAVGLYTGIGVGIFGLWGCIKITDIGVGL